jgi:hypothetical protein
MGLIRSGFAAIAIIRYTPFPNCIGKKLPVPERIAAT